MTGVISLGIGEPNMPTPKLVCEAAKEALDKGLTHYTPNAGTLSFRQAIAEKSYLKDLHYDPNTEIIVTNGGKYTPVSVIPAGEPAENSFNPDDGRDGFADVSGNAWYASAVNYVVDKGLMNGTGECQFSPNARIPRAA